MILGLFSAKGVMIVFLPCYRFARSFHDRAGTDAPRIAVNPLSQPSTFG